MGCNASGGLWCHPKWWGFMFTNFSSNITWLNVTYDVISRAHRDWFSPHFAETFLIRRAAMNKADSLKKINNKLNLIEFLCSFTLFYSFWLIRLTFFISSINNNVTKWSNITVLRKPKSKPTCFRDKCLMKEMLAWQRSFYLLWVNAGLKDW